MVHRNPWWGYFLDRVGAPPFGETDYHYVSTPGSVIIVPVNADGSLVLVRQYRYLMEMESLEFPAGGMKEGERPEDRARRELIEETGLDGALEYAGRFNPCKGVIREWAHVFIARELSASAMYARDHTEEFEVVTLGPEELDGLVRSNGIMDGMTMAAWAMARERLLHSSR